MPTGGQLDPAPAFIEGVAGQPDHMEGIHHRRCIGQLFSGGGLETGKSVHGNDFHSVTPVLWPLSQPLLERFLGPPFDHVEQPCRAGALAYRRQVDDDSDVLVAAAGVTPHVLVDADHPHTVEAGRIGDEYPLAFGKHRVVGGVPRHRQSFSDSGHAQVLADKGFQRPPQSAARQRGPRLGSSTAVLAPHMTAAGASVAAHGDQQRGGPPPERLMGQPSGHGVARAAFLAAAPTPSILVDNPTRQQCPVRLNALPGHLQPELIEPAECGQDKRR